MDRATLYQFLAQHRYGVVSSISQDCVPQSALVGIAVTADLQVIFDTVESSRKFANLVARPSCSFVVGWEAEQTAQIEGTAEHLVGERLAYYLPTYLAAWPDGADRMTWPEIAHFAVRPRWIRYSDFDRTPPFIHEVYL